MRRFLRGQPAISRDVFSQSEDDARRIDPGINPLALGPIVYVNSTSIVGSHGDAVATWPSLSVPARDPIQTVAGQRPALQVTSNLSPLGRQMVLFGGVSPNADNMFFAADLPARTELTVLAYGRADVTGLGALTECYTLYAAQTGDRPDLKVRAHPECFPAGDAAGRMSWSDTTSAATWAEFIIENAKHRFWAWRFNPPEGAGGSVTAFRGGLNGLVKGDTHAFGWGWNEATADGFTISRIDGNAGYRGTLGTVIRYHTALTDFQIQGLYQWHRLNFGFD